MELAGAARARQLSYVNLILTIQLASTTNKCSPKDVMAFLRYPQENGAQPLLVRNMVQILMAYGQLRLNTMKRGSRESIGRKCSALNHLIDGELTGRIAAYFDACILRFLKFQSRDTGNPAIFGRIVAFL